MATITKDFSLCPCGYGVSEIINEELRHPENLATGNPVSSRHTNRLYSSYRAMQHKSVLMLTRIDVFRHDRSVHILS